jgi:hypothetical protein
MNTNQDVIADAGDTGADQSTAPFVEAFESD